MINGDFACISTCDSHSTYWSIFIGHLIIVAIDLFLRASLDNKFKTSTHDSAHISLNKLFRYEYVFDLSHPTINLSLLNTITI
jgi:hypothetical protein